MLIQLLMGAMIAGVICVGAVWVYVGHAAMRSSVRLIRILRSAGRTRDEI